ncbi:hypothetical protein OHC33_007095 [Knufia fluminis]|uniref:C2H2-type domain-containing protein n=1 Tax=Knufia fluminis TaxID=191047 RepID=A0AAN8EHR1_9EURO|nr:hypothetical protein OHC33_007095 [Knufia fluminis]
MQATPYQNAPSVAIHRPTPTTTPMNQQSMTTQSPFAGGVWPRMGGDFLSALPRNFQDPRYHKRASSGGSSVTSNGPESPQQASTYNPRIVSSDATYSPSRTDFDFSPQSAKTVYSMPESMLYANNGGYDMRRIHSSGHDDRASYGGPQSVSTMSHQNSPATPQTWEEQYSEEKPYAGNFPSAAYQQSLQDVFPDQSAQYSFAANNHRHTLQEQFSKSQQQHLRTGSPTSNPRDRSPFKPTSTLMGQVQRPQQQVPQLQKQKTSISPKELMLDENDIEDNQPSLFPEQSFNRQTSNFSNFYSVPSFNHESSVQIPQQYPFVSQSSSQNIPADSTPDFPAHMLSMESTNEEGPSMPSSQESMHRQPPRLERPANVTSDAGTYSCTYHGCPERFESPAKLQKHKREGHRQHESAGPVGTTSALSKNTQAGPHRCDRINPTTGKPCGSIFSRPYDLTRHEDTIHNARKMKVRCHLCTEEKTFSRNDALTRHMRVVHPDVDWVGKQKKRSNK